METRALDLSHGLTIVVRPLANGDVETVPPSSAASGTSPAARRFNGAKPCLSDRELSDLARIDATHHALVAHVVGDPALPRSRSSSATTARAPRSHSSSPTSISTAVSAQL